MFGTLTVVAGWSSGRNCWAPQKKTTFFSDTTKHPRYPWVDFNCCLNFEMFFSISLRKLTNKTEKIYSYRHYAYYPSQGAGATSGGSHLIIASNPGTQVSRNQGTSMRVHPERLTAGNLQITHFWKENDLKQISMMMFHINLQGCNHELRNFLMSLYLRVVFMSCMWSDAQTQSHSIHGTGIFTPTFTINIKQMLVNIPYMDGMGIASNKNW